MPSCRQILQELEDYFEEDSDSDKLHQVREHLSRCRNCRALYDSTRKTLTILTEAGALEIPEEVSSRVVSRIMKRVRQMRTS